MRSWGYQAPRTPHGQRTHADFDTFDIDDPAPVMCCAVASAVRPVLRFPARPGPDPDQPTPVDSNRAGHAPGCAGPAGPAAGRAGRCGQCALAVLPHAVGERGDSRCRRVRPAVPGRPAGDHAAPAAAAVERRAAGRGHRQGRGYAGRQPGYAGRHPLAAGPARAAGLW